jgi:hypothetical protein
LTTFSFLPISRGSAWLFLNWNADVLPATRNCGLLASVEQILCQPVSEVLLILLGTQID